MTSRHQTLWTIAVNFFKSSPWVAQLWDDAIQRIDRTQNRPCDSMQGHFRRLIQVKNLWKKVWSLSKSWEAGAQKTFPPWRPSSVSKREQSSTNYHQLAIEMRTRGPCAACRGVQYKGLSWIEPKLSHKAYLRLLWVITMRESPTCFLPFIFLNPSDDDNAVEIISMHNVASGAAASPLGGIWAGLQLA